MRVSIVYNKDGIQLKLIPKNKSDFEQVKILRNRKLPGISIRNNEVRIYLVRLIGYSTDMSLNISDNAVKVEVEPFIKQIDRIKR